MDFSGCLVVVSHDRYFMDKLVDHVWVLGEDGQTAVRDYPGNYTQYRALRQSEINKNQAALAEAKRAKQDSEAPKIKGDYSVRLSYKERLEFEELEMQLPKLEAQRDELQTKLMQETDHVRLTEMGNQLGNITRQIEEAEMRWLELSERA